ncbi:hypothetical protein [Flavobacterium psychrolimnae]|uniref:Uncharacterized protein n=1 Tax=Flavobacterium psychrolimnae TaxID=249351 RepID=A0A366AZG8_9FLAO|nr:hypothetical protein [Flavobacterium psychrolimnae]RBN49348.1 hypothetical protein DR980_13925 [Flavobacterium psychrolimnae]
MKILGYSERGIINSLIFSIGEDKELMGEFINKITLNEPFNLGKPDRYTVLLEQSFSDFGDADLVIIIHYKDEKIEKADDKIVLFIEGKVKTSGSNWIIKTQFDKYFQKKEYKGYSSNLFYQLYFKKQLIDNWPEIKKQIEKDKIDKKGEKLEIKSFFRNRKIGNNPIVEKAFNLIECKEAYYIGIIPTLQEDINKFNDKIDFEMSFLSWEKVEEFCEENKSKHPSLEKVIEIFDYNDKQIYNRIKKD